jgi:hypothetical protein
MEQKSSGKNYAKQAARPKFLTELTELTGIFGKGFLTTDGHGL